MKKKYIVGCTVLLVIISLIVIFYDRESKEEMVVYKSSSMIMGDCHSENIVVIVNQRKIPDKQGCAERIVKKYRENSFKNIRFSYDLSKPNELDVTVCRNRKEADEGRQDFRFRYVQETEEKKYNIVNDPEKFQIEILDE